MKQKLPWTKSRIIVAVLGIFSLLATLYGLFLATDLFNFSTTSTNEAEEAMAGLIFVYVSLIGTFVAGSLTIVFGVVYSILVRNLRKKLQIRNS